ncbi:unnamed protein product [Eruca vesicaria subsp. sativa]|uniref:Uncharacterized protein n=1 Tax=Eruca vesicaria subsp. sativa TaxID=29727 RepID=A0ABC8M8B5_ERUVS|nr:unnamed protein product [Eruca vesicaria subsp. sativa]
MVKDQCFEGDQKVAKLEKIVGVLTKKKAGVKDGLGKVVCLLFLLILVIVGWKSFGGFEHQCLNLERASQLLNNKSRVLTRYKKSRVSIGGHG